MGEDHQMWCVGRGPTEWSILGRILQQSLRQTRLLRDAQCCTSRQTAWRWSSPAPTCWWTTGTQNNAREEMLSISRLTTQNQKRKISNNFVSLNYLMFFRFCRRDSLVPEYPARSRGNMKVWYTNTEGILGKGRYKN